MLSTAALFRPDGQRQVVWRSSWPERVFVPGFLRPEDIQASEEMLHDSGLETSAPPTTLESLDAARGG
jgi:hypothetical protein